MEVSVSFADGNGPEQDGRYTTDETVLGRVYIPAEGILIKEPARIRYEKHPWIEQFELDGIKAAPARRTGIGSKDPKGFVRSLSTIYARAYEDYREYGGDECFDVRGYFGSAARHFAEMAGDEKKHGMFVKFCGFVENMWREGDAEMLDTAMHTVLPVLRSDPEVWDIFTNVITDEFREYILNT